MRASIYENYGLPEVIQIRAVAKPTPKDKEILVKVEATTVNRSDEAMLKAKPFIMRFVTGLFKPKKPILGTDFAGTIEAIGKNVTAFKVGDNVFGFDDSGLQSHATYMTILEDKGIGFIPPNINFHQAAASIEGAHYAYNFINKVKLKKGQKVLVNGATGAIGSALVQLLVHEGIEVTAVGNTKNIELVKSLGAIRVIDYLKEDFTNEKELFDYVFDAVGKSSFGKCKPILKPNGIYISSELGWMAQNLFYALLTPVFSEKKVIFPIPSDIKKSVLVVQKLLESGEFIPVIDRTYPFGEIVDAFRYVETGEKTGNVIIKINE